MVQLSSNTTSFWTRTFKPVALRLGAYAAACLIYAGIRALLAFLIFPRVSSEIHHDPTAAERAIGALCTAIYDFYFLIVPATIAVLASEMFRLRSWKVYLTAGLCVASPTALSLLTDLSHPRGFKFALILLVAGIISGLVYWALAGRRAGSFATSHVPVGLMDHDHGTQANHRLSWKRAGRIAVAYLVASSVAALAIVALVAAMPFIVDIISPEMKIFESPALRSYAFGKLFLETAVLFPIIMTVVLSVSMPAALFFIVHGEQTSQRRLPFHAIGGIITSIVGLVGLAVLDVIDKYFAGMGLQFEYLLKALWPPLFPVIGMIAGLAGGLTYWLLAGRKAGLVASGAPQI